MTQLGMLLVGFMVTVIGWCILREGKFTPDKIDQAISYGSGALFVLLGIVIMFGYVGG